MIEKNNRLIDTVDFLRTACPPETFIRMIGILLRGPTTAGADGEILALIKVAMWIRDNSEAHIGIALNASGNPSIGA